MFTLKKHFILQNPFFLQYKILYVLKTHFDCFNSQVNNLDDMEREQLFYGHKEYFGKIKRLAGQEIYFIIKSKMYNFMYVNEIKIKIGYITNIFYGCKLSIYFLSLTH